MIRKLRGFVFHLFWTQWYNSRPISFPFHWHKTWQCFQSADVNGLKLNWLSVLLKRFCSGLSFLKWKSFFGNDNGHMDAVSCPSISGTILSSPELVFGSINQSCTKIAKLDPGWWRKVQIIFLIWKHSFWYFHLKSFCDSVERSNTSSLVLVFLSRYPWRRMSAL